ncbi:hypothetical protein IHE45_06G027500 [Dioscorea alata]|uniref:Uncharacterized protein n=1 Tax=Dioscorea alata TaxID=55571 RepID=A0ACB7VW49_DIOAL|nr:hypothetical protein IHE45_06G027500 [Dioscorea alata]
MDELFKIFFLDKCRHQKEEALNFRVVKEKEVCEIEEELGAEIATLEKQRDGLEAELKKVLCCYSWKISVGVDFFYLVMIVPTYLSRSAIISN